MNLYLCNHKITQLVSNITLKDGCYPAIGSQVSEQLEPAQWFKVLVLDTVTIDCKKQLIIWQASIDDEELRSVGQQWHSVGTKPDAFGDGTPSTNQTEADEGEEENKERLSLDGIESASNWMQNEAYCILRRHSSRRVIEHQMSEMPSASVEGLSYCSDIEEVFELTSDILLKFSLGQLSETEFNLHIFRLLHVHILPNIKLSLDHIVNVRNALAITDCYLTDVDALILAKQEKADRVEASLKKMRLKLIQDICDTDFSNSSFSLDFAKLLLQHLASDISSSQQELNELTQKVEKAKDSLMTVQDDSVSDELSSLRVKRNQFMEDFNRLLTARAILDEYISSDQFSEGQKTKIKKQKKKSRSKSEKHAKSHVFSQINESNHLHAVYIGMDETHRMMLADTLTLANKKVLLLSIKETIRSTLKTLLSGKETSGVDIDTTGMKRPTDVLHHSQIPLEWLTLPEQVSAILSNASLPVKKAHEHFCMLVRKKCEDALKRRELSMITESISQEVEPPVPSVTSTGGLYEENKLYNVIHKSSSQQSLKKNRRRSGSEGQIFVSCSSRTTSCFSSSSGDLSKLKQNKIKPVDSDSLLAKDWRDPEVKDESIEKLETLEQTLAWIKQKINDTFEDICLQIQQHLVGDSDCSSGQAKYRRIWQCYEMHFFSRVIDPLSKLYVKVHGEKISHVFNEIKHLKAQDLDLDGFLLNTLQDVDLLNEFTDLQVGESTSSVSNTDSTSCVGDLYFSSGSASLKSSDSDHANSFLQDSSEVETTDVRSAEYPGSSVPSGNNSLDRFARQTTVEDSGTFTDESETLKSSVEKEIQPFSKPAAKHITESVDGCSDVPDKKSDLCLSVCPASHSSQTGVKVQASVNKSLQNLCSSGDDLNCNVNKQSSVPSNVSVPLSPLSLPQHKSLQFKAEFLQRFSNAYKVLEQTLEGTSPLYKLQQLCMCLHELSRQHEQLQQQFCTKSSKPCTDDLIDILVVFLCNFHPAQARQLYAYIMLLSDLMPQFCADGQFSFVLVQFLAAFQVLQERSMMKNAKQLSKQTAPN